MNIVVLDGYPLNPGDNPWDEIAELGDLTVYDQTPEDLILRRAQGAEILLTGATSLNARTLARLTELRFISVLSTGYNAVDIAAAGRQGVPVSNAPAYGTDSVAQFTFALLLELCHHAGVHDEAVKAGEWSSSPVFCFWKTPLVELRGKKIGIVGFGRIGRRVGEIAHAFGMEVLAFNPRVREAPAYEPFSWCSLPDLFAKADTVTLHSRQTPENIGFVDRTLIGTMKKSAFFINTARGALVNEQHLAEALNAGHLAGAAVDVVSAEPIQPSNPLLNARHCIITPHIAWATLEARRKLITETAQNIRAFFEGHPVNVVNDSYLSGKKDPESAR